MVKSTLTKVEQFEQEIAIEDAENNIKWCTVSLLDVVEHGKRLEASVFDVEAKNARETIKGSKWPKTNLNEGNLIKEAFYPGRFKRIYVDKENGEPFYLPSQINDIFPKEEKYISRLTKCNIDDLRVKEGEILLTRSGTIGNITIVSKTLNNKIFSDDVIRIKMKNNYDIGYVYTYLKTKVGSKILQTNKYGSVITHIEPEHLERIEIPNAPTKLKEKINKLIEKSFCKIDKSNSLMTEAEKLLIDELCLPNMDKLNNLTEDRTQTFNIRLSDINNRIDASYHIPIANEIISLIKKHSKEITYIGDPKISKDVILPGRFKRVYVDEGYGVKFLGSKVMKQLNPSTEKYLSKKIHQKQLNGALGIKENSILLAARGTIGDFVLASKQFVGWAISDNMMQILSYNNICGYIYVFLSTDYGKVLTKKFVYGGVVDAIEPDHIKQIPIPLLKNDAIQKKINDMALQANQLRYEAYCLEQEAIQTMNREVIYAK